MSDLNYLAILVAAVAAFVLSSTWYVVVGYQGPESTAGTEPAQRPPAWMIAAELARSLVVGTVVALAATKMDVTTWTGGLLLGLVAWIGFPFVLLTGSMIWDKVPFRTAAVHAGDWLLKLLMIAVVVSVWN